MYQTSNSLRSLYSVDSLPARCWHIPAYMNIKNPLSWLSNTLKFQFCVDHHGRLQSKPIQCSKSLGPGKSVIYDNKQWTNSTGIGNFELFDLTQFLDFRKTNLLFNLKSTFRERSIQNWSEITCYCYVGTEIERTFLHPSLRAMNLKERTRWCQIKYFKIDLVSGVSSLRNN